MAKRLAMVAIVLSFAASMYAAKISEGFEDKTVLKKWELEGDVVISADQQHGGKSSLYTPPGSTAIFRFSPENRFGTVTMWVYDSFTAKKGKSDGPYFGLINSDDDKAVEIISYKPYLNINDYSEVFTAENQWYSPWHSAIRRTAAKWAKFTFTFTDKDTLNVNYNDTKDSVSFSTKLEFFNKGANGIVFGGGSEQKPKNEAFYYDDVEIDVKDAEAAPKAAPVKK